MSITEVKELPPRSFRKGSKYDEILNEYIKSNFRNAVVNSNIKGEYLVLQLRKRIKIRGLTNIEAKMINSKAYLCKIA